MKQKIVFLDVDGELTYSDYENRETAGIDVEKVKLLKEICDKTDAKVVISSSWRGMGDYVPKIYTTLLNILNQYDITVVGNTPYIPTEFDENIPADKEFQVKYGTGRGAEIRQWISEHEIDRFVILDDEDWNWSAYDYDKYWIQPTWFGDGGLKREHVDRAIEILNKVGEN